MATKTFLGKIIELTDEGYFVNSSDWSVEIAREYAKEEGIELTDTHVQLLNWLREKVAKGESLTIRSIGNSGICDVKAFYALFPGAPLKKATKIAGVAKPASCI